jgi:hypothetical protein
MYISRFLGHEHPNPNDNSFILLFIFLPFRLPEGNGKKEIRVIYFYEFKVWRSAAQTARSLNEVFGEETMNEPTVQLLFKKFRIGDQSVGDQEGRGLLPAVNNDQLRTLVERLTHVKWSEKLDKWVLHELNEK